MQTQAENYAVGIDVAHFDGEVEWAAVLAAGWSFGYAKATEGVSFVDPLFAQNWQQMGEVGITRGAYHFFRPSVDAEQQARHFLSTVQFLPTDLPAALDVEVIDRVAGEALIVAVRSWLNVVAAETGRTPIIYTGPAFWSANLDDSFGEYPLWIAHYTSASRPRIPAGWSDWTFWQYAGRESGEVHVPGVTGGVDADRFNGSHEELVARFGLRQ